MYSKYFTNYVEEYLGDGVSGFPACMMCTTAFENGTELDDHVEQCFVDNQGKYFAELKKLKNNQ